MPFKCVTMFKWWSWSCTRHWVTFPPMEFHTPCFLPLFKAMQVFLQDFTVFLCVYVPVQYTVICEKSSFRWNWCWKVINEYQKQKGPNTDIVVLHWLLVVDLTFHHPVKPVEFCLTGRILPISRCYLLFHNSPFSSVVYYGALYRMPWRNPICWGQFGYSYEDFLPAHVRESTTVSRSYVWPEIHVDSLLGSYVHQGGSRCLSQLYARGSYSIYMSVTQVCNCWQGIFLLF